MNGWRSCRQPCFLPPPLSFHLPEIREAAISTAVSRTNGAGSRRSSWFLTSRPPVVRAMDSRRQPAGLRGRRLLQVGERGQGLCGRRRAVALCWRLRAPLYSSKGRLVATGPRNPLPSPCFQSYHCSGSDTLLGSASVGASIFILLFVGFVVGFALSWLIWWRRQQRRDKLEVRGLVPWPGSTGPRPCDQWLPAPAWQRPAWVPVCRWSTGTGSGRLPSMTGPRFRTGTLEGRQDRHCHMAGWLMQQAESSNRLPTNPAHHHLIPSPGSRLPTRPPSSRPPASSIRRAVRWGGSSRPRSSCRARPPQGPRPPAPWASGCASPSSWAATRHAWRWPRPGLGVATPSLTWRITTCCTTPSPR